MTILEVLPLLPSQTIGNVGHKYKSEATQLANRLSQYGAYCGVIHEQGTKPYKYNHMQEENRHEGSPQMNWVFEFMRHKQSLDKEIFYTQLFSNKV